MVGYTYRDVLKLVIDFQRLIFDDYYIKGISGIKKLTPVDHGFFRVVGVPQEKYWGQFLTKKQQKGFSKILPGMLAIPEKMHQINNEFELINFKEVTFKFSQVTQFQEMIQTVVGKAINFYEFPEVIEQLPKKELRQMCGIRRAAHLQIKRFLKKALTFSGNNIVSMTLDSFHEEWRRIQKLESIPWFVNETAMKEMFKDAEDKSLQLKEENWKRFFLDKDEDSQYQNCADVILSKDLNFLELEPDFVEYLKYTKKVKTIGELVALDSETLETLISDIQNSIGKSKISVKIVAEKLTLQGLSIGISREDLISVCNTTDLDVLKYIL